MTKWTTWLAAAAFSASAWAAGGGAHLDHVATDVSDRTLLKRGAQLFFNYCSGCHSLQYMRYSRIAEDLEIPEAEVMSKLNFTGAKFGDPVTIAMPSGKDSGPPGGEDWFTKAPPDLSLTARSRGVDWIYTFLRSYYLDPTRPFGWNNTVLANTVMPNPLWDLQGVQRAVLAPKSADAQGHEHCAAGQQEIDGQCLVRLESEGGLLDRTAFDQEVRALTTFLEYVGEPAILQRERYGIWVILYLLVFTGLAWLLKHEYWRDVH